LGFEPVTSIIDSASLNLTPGDSYFIGLTTELVTPVGVPDCGSSILLLLVGLLGIGALALRRPAKA
jgi:hypothetical protein